MREEKDMVPRDEARKAARDLCRRIGLLHMCYARTLLDELGEEKGKELIRKAIWDYGTKVGERTREQVQALGLEPNIQNMGSASDLSPIGFDTDGATVRGERRSRTYNCAIAEIWKEYGETELGGLYCLVDPAKMQAYDPHWTMVHIKKVTEGDDYCEIATRPVESTAGE